MSLVTNEAAKEREEEGAYNYAQNSVPRYTPDLCLHVCSFLHAVFHPTFRATAPTMALGVLNKDVLRDLLRFAIMRHDHLAFKALLEIGNVTEYSKLSVILFDVIKADRDDFFHVALERKRNPEVAANTCDSRGWTLLMAAAKHNCNRSLVNLLQVPGIHVNAEMWNKGWTALHVACYLGNENPIKSLLEAGANPLLSGAHRDFPSGSLLTPKQCLVLCKKPYFLDPTRSKLFSLLESYENKFTTLGSAPLSSPKRTVEENIISDDEGADEVGRYMNAQQEEVEEEKNTENLPKVNTLENNIVYSYWSDTLNEHCFV